MFSVHRFRMPSRLAAFLDLLSVQQPGSWSGPSRVWFVALVGLVVLALGVGARLPGPPARVVVRVQDPSGGGVDSASVRMRRLDGPEVYAGLTGRDGSVTFENVATPVRQGLQLPLEYRLSQAWPNPSQDRARLTMQVARQGDVKVEVYNILGQQVASAQQSLEPGVYDLNIRLPSPGVYIARVQAQGKAYTRKIAWTGSQQPGVSITPGKKPGRLRKTSQAASYVVEVQKPEWISTSTKQPVATDTVTIDKDTTLTYTLEYNEAPRVTWISPSSDTTLDNEDSLEVKVVIDDPNKQPVTASFYMNDQYLGQTTISTPPETLTTKLKFDQAQEDTTLQARIEATDGQKTTTSQSPKVTIHPHPDITITIKPLYTPEIDTSFTTPPPINGQVIIAQLDGTGVDRELQKYTLYELYSLQPDPKNPTLRPEKIIDTLQVQDGKAQASLEKGKNYRFIIQIPGYHEHVSSNTTLTPNDTSLTFEIADTTNLPKAHTATVVYGGYDPNVNDFGRGIKRIIRMDSVYISTQPAKGSGNPVPQEYIDIIKQIYEQDLQGKFMHTSLYPEGPLANIKIVIGDNPPPDGTPNTIIYRADDTIPFVASFGSYTRGFAGCEIYSITISYHTNLGDYPPKAIFLHEAASLFQRNNSPGDDEVPSVFDIGSKYEQLQEADLALIRLVFARPINPDLEGTPYYPNGTNARYFDQMYR